MGNLLIANIGGIVFLRGTFDQIVYIHGGKAPGWLAFSFSLDIQGSNLLAHGTTLKPDYCYVFYPEREVDLRSVRAF
ncbi:MAG: hypothetical protein WCA07_09120 [Gloeobacterales cyanobacterium]